MKRCLVIINPTSGQQTIQKNLDKIIGQLVLRNLVSSTSIHYTTGNKDAYLKILQTPKDAFDFYIVAGGDGTIKEVVSALIDSKKQTPVALLPAGTVNDLGNYLQLPTTIDNFVNMIEQWHITSMDVGKFNNDYFINVVAAGMLTDIGYNVSKDDKKRLGSFAYYFRGFIQLPKEIKRRIPVTITLDDKITIEQSLHFVVVSNTSRVAGFDDFCPEGSIDDGFFDILMLRSSHIGDMATFAKDFLFRRHKKNNNVSHYRAKKIVIESTKKDVHIDVDGEFGGHLPCTIELLPLAINILTPEK